MKPQFVDESRRKKLVYNVCTPGDHDIFLFRSFFRLNQC